MPPTLLDTRGLHCPLPVLKARKRLAAMPAGARLLVLATDPRAPADLAELCRSAGHRLLQSGTNAAGELELLLERG